MEFNGFFLVENPHHQQYEVISPITLKTVYCAHSGIHSS